MSIDINEIIYSNEYQYQPQHRQQWVSISTKESTTMSIDINNSIATNDYQYHQKSTEMSININNSIKTNKYRYQQNNRQQWVSISPTKSKAMSIDMNNKIESNESIVKKLTIGTSRLKQLDVPWPKLPIGDWGHNYLGRCNDRSCYCNRQVHSIVPSMLNHDYPR